MFPAERLRDKLIVANGKGIQVYREVAGAYRFDRFELYIEGVQTEAAIPTACVRIRVDQAEAQVPPALWSTSAGRVAVEDFLARSARDAVHKHVRTRWPGRLAPLTVDAGGQEILVRNCVVLREEFVEVRGTMTLPAEGRKVASKPAQAFFFDELPAVVASGLTWAGLDGEAARRHVQVLEDYIHLREALPSLGLAAFVADGSVLPRESAFAERPLRGGRVIPFVAPDELAVTVELPSRGPVRGLGIPRGVTVVAGGAFSGKSTLVAALASGVFPHEPGDGRELVAACPDAVMILSEPGRRIERADLGAAFREMPNRPSAASVSYERAPGVVSMAAAVAEALEIGTGLLLFDEDEGATPYLARDAAMQRLVAKGFEPLTTLLDQVRSLWEDHGVSVVIATGGLGDYLDVADTVIVMEGCKPQAATARARAITEELGRRRANEGRSVALPAPRVPLPRGFAGFKTRGARTEMRGRTAVGVGRESVDISGIRQLVDPGQMRAVGDAILHALDRGYVDGNASISEILDRVFGDIEDSGLGVLTAQQAPTSDYAMPRRHEVAAVLNRLRALQARQRRPAPVRPDQAEAGESPGCATARVQEATSEGESPDRVEPGPEPRPEPRMLPDPSRDSDLGSE